MSTRRRAGHATAIEIRLNPSDSTFQRQGLSAAVTPRTRANTPMNSIGEISLHDELHDIARRRSTWMQQSLLPQVRDSTGTIRSYP